MNRPSPDNMDLDIGHRERERQRHPTDRLLTTMKNHAIDLYHYTLFVFSSLILSLTLRHTCSFAHLLWSAVAFIYFFFALFCCVAWIVVSTPVHGIVETTIHAILQYICA